MSKIKRLVTDESGAASVLVIFMMLALVTLGTFSITSAGVNYAFNRRALEWNRAYYETDAMAEVFLAKADAALALAESAADETKAENADMTENELSRLRESLAANALESLKSEYPGAEIITGGETITVRVNFRAVSREESNLALTIEAVPTAEPGSARYRIIEWRQWQTNAAA